MWYYLLRLYYPLNLVAHAIKANINLILDSIKNLSAENNLFIMLPIYGTIFLLQ